jgi:hypothetical protein
LMLFLFGCSKTACSVGSVFNPASDTNCNVHVFEQLFSVAM